MKHIIWTSRFDLSTGGVENFCKEAAGRYGKTEEQLRALPLLELASCYMWNERRRRLQEMQEKLSPPTQTPIIVFADIADFGNQSHKECHVLSGIHLSDIFSCKQGLVTTFFSDGKDVRCEDITEDGTNFYLFREVTNLKGLDEFIASVKRGEPFTDSQLSQFTRSIAPQVHQLLGWPMEEKEPLETQISRAGQKTDSPHAKKSVPLER